MAQVSRPFQIGIAAVAVLACVWLFALRGHSSTSNEPASSSSSQAASSSAPGTHNAAPGVEGLAKDVEKAHGAAAASEHNAAELQKHSEAVSGNSTTAAPAPTQHTSAPSTPTTRTATAHPSKPASSSASGGTAAVAQRNQAIEARLAAGGVVLILFWNSKGSVDAAVHQALQRLPERNISIYAVAPNQVASFGALTHSIQVFQTPTLVVIGPSRQAAVTTGLTDTYAVQQTISEALKAKR